MPSAEAGLQGLYGLRLPSCLRKIARDPLMGLCSPTESSKLERPPAHPEGAHAAPPMRFLPLQRLPARDSGKLAGFASPDRLHLQVFSTSWRLDPPRACRPCFMPDPLMGLRPSELCSSRAAVRRLRRPYPHDVRQLTPTVPITRTRQPKPPSTDDVLHRAQRPKPPRCEGAGQAEPAAEATDTEGPSGTAPRAFPPSGFCSTRESATPDRRFRPARARSSPGLSALQGVPPR
jgi:hypothetical protein